MKAMIPHMWLENLAAYSLQVAVLILAGTMLIHLFRLKAPAVLLVFWQTLLVLCLLLPALQPWRQVGRAIQSAAVPAIEIPSLPTLPSLDAAPLVTAPAPPRSIPFPTRGTIALILGAGIGLRFLWLALGLLRLRRYRHRSRRLWVLPESIRDLQWRVGVAPEVLLSKQIDSPVTFGWRRPAVLFPEAFTEMSESLQRPIACHEMLHVERRDWLYIVLEEILRSLFWFHPGVWWALGRIHLSREQVVDREVLRITGARGPYLESLLHFASLRGRPAAVPAPLLLKERHLVQRVALMLKESTMSRFRLTISLTAVAACLLAAGTLVAAWFPLTAPPAPEPQAAAVTALVVPAPAPSSAKAPVRSEKLIPQMRQREPLHISPNHQATKLRRKVDPVYPDMARLARVAQAVTLEVLVNERGQVANTKVVRGHPLLNQAVIHAVKQWRYSPTYDFNGEAVPVITTVTIDLPPVHEYATGWVGMAAVSGIVVGVLPSSTLPPTPSTRQENPTPAAQQREPVQVGANIMESRLLKRVDPVYPEIAVRARMEGVVRLQVLVNEQGEVASVRVIGGGYPPLQPAAAEAVRQWRYSPTYLNGEAVPVMTTVNVTFKLTGGTSFIAPAAQPTVAYAGQLPRREPMRVGGNVQDSKLIHRVDPEYPELARRARVETMVMLEVLVNEQGEVANVRLIRGHPLLDQAAMDAVKQWRYSPTYLNGEAVPVIATQTVIFKLSDSPSEIRIIIDQDGSLKDLEGNPITRAMLKDRRAAVQIPAGSQATYAVINQTLRYLQEQGVQDLRLVATAYRYTGGRLFYAVGGTFVSPSVLPRPIPEAGAETSVQPAQLGIDLEGLAAMVKASGLLPGNPGTTTTLFYTVYVTETGQIVAVDDGMPQLPGIAAALRQARVIAPGRRGNELVPTAVLVVLSIKW